MLQNIYKSLVEDASSRAEKEIDECVIKALIDLDDEQEINGNPKYKTCDALCDEMSEYL